MIPALSLYDSLSRLARVWLRPCLTNFYNQRLCLPVVDRCALHYENLFCQCNMGGQAQVQIMTEMYLLELQKC